MTRRIENALICAGLVFGLFILVCLIIVIMALVQMSNTPR